MSFAIFDTHYAKINKETLRWVSVSLAALCVVISFVLVAWLRKLSFKNNSSGKTSETATIIVGTILFLLTVAATFMSWFVAALHINYKYLIAVDIINAITFILLTLYATISIKYDKQMDSLMVCSLILELTTLIILSNASTSAGTNGSIMQSVLLTPLLGLSVYALCRK